MNIFSLLNILFYNLHDEGLKTKMLANISMK